MNFIIAEYRFVTHSKRDYNRMIKIIWEKGILYRARGDYWNCRGKYSNCNFEIIYTYDKEIVLNKYNKLFIGKELYKKIKNVFRLSRNL